MQPCEMIDALLQLLSIRVMEKIKSQELQRNKAQKKKAEENKYEIVGCGRKEKLGYIA